MVDWQAIKTEYVTTATSYRKLADKYGVGRAVIGHRAVAEKWTDARQKYRDETTTKAINAIGAARATRAAKIAEVSDKLLDRVKALLDGNGEAVIDISGLKDVSVILKNVKEIQMIKSEADVREQEARIRNLERQIEAEKKPESITISIEGGDQAWRG